MFATDRMSFSEYSRYFFRAALQPFKDEAANDVDTWRKKMATKLKSEKVGMTFNMPEDWHAEFKTAAIAMGMSMHVLLLEAFEAWQLVQQMKLSLNEREEEWALKRQLKS